MRARIPYLAGLARQDAGQPPLRPPSRPFASDVYASSRSPARPASALSDTGDAAVGGIPGAVPRASLAGEPVVSHDSTGITPWRSGNVGAGETKQDRFGVAPPAAATPVVPSVQAVPVPEAGASTAVDAAVVGPATDRGEKSVGAPEAPPGRGVAKPATLTPKPRPDPSAVSALSAGEGHATAAAPADLAVSQLLPAAPVPPLASRAASDLADRVQAAVNPSPVAPPGTPTPADASAQTPPTGAAEVAPRARPEPTPPTIIQWGVPVELPQALDPPSDQRAGPVGNAKAFPLTAGSGDSAGGPLPARGSGAIHVLLPPAPAIDRPSSRSGGPRDAGGSSRARVSIGTIEVTVVPPARPTPPASDIRAFGQPAPTASRARSMLATGPGSNRLRDGLRRWHGTAQG